MHPSEGLALKGIILKLPETSSGVFQKELISVNHKNDSLHSEIAPFFSLLKIDRKTAR